MPCFTDIGLDRAMFNIPLDTHLLGLCGAESALHIHTLDAGILLHVHIF